VAGVRRGDQVIAGQPIGMLVLSAGHCLPGACLHLGRRLGETYLDPLELLGGGPVRLLPRSAPMPIPHEAPMPIPRSAPMPIPSEAPMLVPDPVEAPEVPDRPPPSPMPALTSPEAWTPGTAATLVSSVIVALRSGVEAAQSRG